MLTIEEARRQLELGNERNPGPWKLHSISVAENARDRKSTRLNSSH